MKLLDLLPEAEENQKDVAYFHLQDSHVSFLKAHPATRVTQVEPLQADKYTGDFFGLLDYLRVGKKYHFVVMRVNGLYSSGDFDGEMQSVLIPPLDEVNKIFTIYNSLET